MRKVYPCKQSSSSSATKISSGIIMYTIWMKSLVVNGNGYTVYDSNGKVVYRIDNYDIKCRNEVYLMDLHGNVLCTISKKLLRFGVWEGYKGNGPRLKNEKPWFEVTNNCMFLKRDSEYRVSIGNDKNHSTTDVYKIGGMIKKKSEFKIINGQGIVVAEVQQKLSACGVVLGQDVLSLQVEATADQSFIMALVAVYGLFNNRM